MAWLSTLARLWLLRRLFARRRYPSRGHRHGYGWPARRSGSSRQRGRGRAGLFGPFPYYSGRTRRGTHVRVGGCCLPIPLALAAAIAAGLRLLGRR